MNVNKKLKLCILSNFILLSTTIIIIGIFSNKSGKYWNFGPNENLIIISVKIDNWTKYSILLTFIAFLKSTKCIIAEIAHPIIGFNIYNPDKKVITEFTKIELQVYGNSMYLIDNIRYVFMIMITISQIDVALWGVFIAEFTSIFMIRYLLNEKKFSKDKNIFPPLNETLIQ